MNAVLTRKANPARQNLVVLESSQWADSQFCQDVGFTFGYPYSKGNQDNPLIYNSHYYELSDLLVTKLTKEYDHYRTNQKLRSIMDHRTSEWSEEAQQWFTDSKDLLHTIKCIKEMDMDIITAVIKDFGLDPEDFKERREMRPWQLQALAMNIKLQYFNNWGQMRTGKTPPAIIYHGTLYMKELVKLVLVVVPNSIKWTWYNELAKDLPIAMQVASTVVEGTKAKRKTLWEKYNVFKIVSYDTLRADIDIITELLEEIPWSVIIDESHFIKNASKRTNCITGLFQSDNPPYAATFTSGTAVANTPIDVARPVNLTAPSLLSKSVDEFTNRYTLSRGNRLIYKRGALEDIQNKMARCSVRALRVDCNFGLGMTIEPKILPMSTRQEKIYKQIQTILRGELYSEHGEWTTIKIRSMLAKTQKLQQVTDGFLYDEAHNPIWMPEDDQPKVQWLDEYIDSYLPDIDKLVIFSRFTAVLARLQHRYRKHGAVRIDGSVKKTRDRDDIVTKFQSDPDTHIMLMNTAVAMGQDLNPATFAIAYDRMFYLMPNDQADARITGINQTGEATIIPLVCEKTVDQALVFKVLPKKRENADIVMGDGGRAMAKVITPAITTEDLFTLIG